MNKPIKTLVQLLRHAVLRALVIILIAELSIASLPVMAGGITVDQNAAGNKPTVDAAPNGVPLVNLAKTDGRGVSHNKFTDYNVGANGVILNNSTADGVSILGGAVCGNPNYRGGSAASLVINEVTGNKASNLLGYTEMFGKRADFILANPNGIVINGAGFINMSRVTLSTGVPMFNLGMFQGLDVRGGSVSIEGRGVDASQADYFGIVTRMASLSGPLWGRDVSIITGTGFYNYNDRVFTLRDTPDGKPEFAIDASALGSIYAGRISLICNEKGVGVRSRADMLADAGDIRINADGNIELRNVQAATEVNVRSYTGEIVQTGTALALGDLTYNAAKITNRGSLLSLNTLSLTGILDNEGGEIASSGNINIATSGVLNNRNGIIKLCGTDTGSIIINGLDSLDGAGGSITSSGALVLGMAGDITLSDSTGTLYAEKMFTLNAANVVNDTSLKMNGSISINATGNVTTNAGSALVSNNAVNLTSNGVVNNGEISGNAINIHAGTLENSGVIAGGNSIFSIDIAGDITNYGRISSASDLVITAAHVTNSDLLASSNIYPEISSGHNLSITANGISNSGGLIFAVTDMKLNTASLSNISTNISEDNLFGNAYIYSMGTMEINGSAAAGNTLLNYSGYIQSDGNMSIDLKSDGVLTNTGADFGAYTTGMVTIGGEGDEYYALMKQATLTPGDMRTASGYIVSKNDLDITSGEVRNHGSVISADKDMTITANAIHNETNSEDVYFSKYQYYGMHHVHKYKDNWGNTQHLHRYYYYWTSGTLTVYSNTKALIQAGGNLTIHNEGGTITNTGIIQTPGTLNIASGSVINGGGYTALANTTRNGDTSSNLATLKNTGVIDVSQYVTLDGNGNAMFAIDTNPGTTYLIETRNQYIDVSSLYGSQYFFDRIDYDPENIKILGDAYYEEQIVLRAIYQATAEKYLSENITSDQEQMKYLLDNAATAYKDLKLAVGVELTKEQINSLQEPILWYVTETVKGITVLAPKIYIPEHIVAGYTNGGTPKIAGNTVNMNITDGLANSGLIQGKSSVNIKAGEILNTSAMNGVTAEIKGGDVTIESKGDIINRSAVIKADKTLNITAAGDIVNETTVETTNLPGGEVKSVLGTTASIESGDRLTINAGGDVTNRGAEVKSGSDALINAGGNIDFETVKLHDVTHESRYGVHGVSDTTTSIGSDLEVGGNLAMSSGRDINFVGSTADIKGKGDVKTAGNFNLLNDYDTDSFKGSKTSHGTFSKKTTKVESYDKTVVGSSFKTGDDLNVESGNDINIVGSAVSSGKDMKLDAAGTENIVAVNDEHYFKKETKKSGLGEGGSVYGSKLKSDMTYDSKVKGSTVDAKEKYASHSGKDTNIIGSTLTAGDMADISADGNVNIVAAYDRHDEEHKTVKSGYVGAHNLSSQELDLKGKGNTTAIGSTITAGKLAVKSGADVTIIGSTLNADSASIDAAGNFTEMSAENTSYDYEVHQKTSSHFISSAKDLAQYKDGRLYMQVAKVNYHKLETDNDSTTQSASTLNITNGLSITTGKDLTVAGSDIIAGGDVTLTAGGNINIITTEESTKTSSKDISGSGKATVGVKNAVTDAYYAEQALVKARDELSRAIKDYDKYKENLAQARKDKDNGLIDQDDYDRLASEEKYFVTNIALLSANVAQKTTNLVNAAAGALGNMKTLGFSIDVQADITATVKKDSSESSMQKGSNLLAGGNLTIKSGNTAKIEGSNVSAQGDMLIDAQNVEITAGQNTEKTHSTVYNEHLNFTASFATMDSWGVNGDTSHTWSGSESISWVNSHLSANNITIKSAKDTTVSGGVITADNNLDLNVGGNLVVQSLQDTSTSYSYTYGANGGYSETKDKDNNKTGSGNYGANFNISQSDRKWVTEQTSLTGSHVNIYVEKKTALTGAVIASTSNDLTLNTGSFEYRDIKDKDISWNGGLNGSAGKSYVTKNDGSNKDTSKSNSEKHNTWSASLTYGYSEKRQTNFATIGEGTIVVRDGASNLTSLKRDVTKSQYGTVDVGLKGGLTVDSSTVDMVKMLATKSPGEIYDDAKTALETGYKDAKKTTVDQYQRTSNYLNERGYFTEAEIIKIGVDAAMTVFTPDISHIRGSPNDKNIYDFLHEVYGGKISGNYDGKVASAALQQVAALYGMSAAEFKDAYQRGVIGNEFGSETASVLAGNINLRYAVAGYYKEQSAYGSSVDYSGNRNSETRTSTKIIGCSMFGFQDGHGDAPKETQIVQSKSSVENTMREWANDDSSIKNGTASIYFGTKGLIGGAAATAYEGLNNDVLEPGVNYDPANAAYERGKRLGTVVDVIIMAEGVFSLTAGKTIINSGDESVGVRNKVGQTEKSVIYVTKDGVALPPGTKVPDGLIENPYRSGSYGKIDPATGRFSEKLRVDPATPPGMKGPNESHFHLNGNGNHQSDMSKWPVNSQ